MAGTVGNVIVKFAMNFDARVVGRREKLPRPRNSDAVTLHRKLPRINLFARQRLGIERTNHA